MMAIDWGHGVEDTARRLMEESTKAQENGEAYALQTATRAAAAVARRGVIETANSPPALMFGVYGFLVRGPLLVLTRSAPGMSTNLDTP